jgi:hypothetical protein
MSYERPIWSVPSRCAKPSPHPDWHANFDGSRLNQLRKLSWSAEAECLVCSSSARLRSAFYCYCHFLQCSSQYLLQEHAFNVFGTVTSREIFVRVIRIRREYSGEGKTRFRWIDSKDMETKDWFWFVHQAKNLFDFIVLTELWFVQSNIIFIWWTDGSVDFVIDVKSIEVSQTWWR